MGIVIITSIILIILLSYFAFNYFCDSCLFCKKKFGEELRAVCKIEGGEYSGTTRYVYHPSCYINVLKNPEDYGHKLVDYAIEVDTCLSRRDHTYEIIGSDSYEREKKRKEALLRVKEINERNSSI